jgi:hypothetical protein
LYVAGGDSFAMGPLGAPQANSNSFQIFKPPYMFSDFPGWPRPVITSAPTEIHYGQVFTIGTPDADSITTIRLLRTSSSTHSFDMNTRLIELAPGPNDLDQAIEAQAPPHGYQAPPGWYQLYVCKGPNGNLPSTGRFVRLIP